MFRLKNKKKEVTITLQIPEGYEFNEKALSFDNIFKKKNIEPIIRWADGDVEINADGEHFILDASNPTAMCNWIDAKRYCNELYFGIKKGQLPTINQLKVIAKYFDKINKVISENNGYPLTLGWYWSREEKDEFCVWYIRMLDGYTSYGSTLTYNYVRAVRHL
jgi:hypothetical protein